MPKNTKDAKLQITRNRNDIIIIIYSNTYRQRYAHTPFSCNFASNVDNQLVTIN